MSAELEPRDFFEPGGPAQLEPAQINSTAPPENTPAAATEFLFTLPIPSDDKWKKQAACKGEPTNMFFPAAPGKKDITTVAMEAPAKAICGRCVVRLECLGSAVGDNTPVGIYGGLNIAQRRPLVTANRKGILSKGVSLPEIPGGYDISTPAGREKLITNALDKLRNAPPRPVVARIPNPKGSIGDRILAYLQTLPDGRLEAETGVGFVLAEVLGVRANAARTAVTRLVDGGVLQRTELAGRMTTAVILVDGPNDSAD